MFAGKIPRFSYEKWRFKNDNLGFYQEKWRFKPQDHDFAGNNGDSHLKMVVSIKLGGLVYQSGVLSNKIGACPLVNQQNDMEN